MSGDDAEPVYRELFGLAVARDIYIEAEPAALRYLKTGSKDPRDQSMALLIALIAKANRGDYDGSLKDIETYFKVRPEPKGPEQKLDPSTGIALGEAYLQRLIRGGRYDIARKVCALAIEHASDPTIKAHFQGRQGRLDMLGKPAPAIVGTNVDGKTVQLSDLKGKVVLVDFWATWCPPCVAAIPELKALDSKFSKDGFEILGVNLDALRQDVGDITKAKPVVRQFLLSSGAGWPNILIGPGATNDPTRAYGVDEIPANFLVDRSGKIIHVEQIGPELEKAIAEIMGAK